MEMWDVYDKDRKLTGKQMRRGDAFEQGDFHLVIHVCLFNQQGEMLIQQRQPNKDHWQNMWDLTVGGSALAGETSQQAAEREVEEEIGLVLNLQKLRPSVTVNFEYGFDDYYVSEIDVDLRKLPLPTEEVSQVKWAAKDAIFHLISEGQFIPYHESLISLLFDTRHMIGAHKN
ncbi:NUDIX domain-containing protein [Rummeliibacillus sp. G93]|uniref:NUDIX hydrolase n=1 Tax=Rummeliibacillus TaxID=648802 RepID=UPI0011667129|nr:MULTISPECIES: NUDIX domain-containing protein [Rummeliibacillus]MBB5171059.1 isopentenyldiphosphate isomerase [Rummeliibacillus stabekisii]UQW96743.1 NUDIX domain-containing protein [Rummeliibacillus sp. G93]GEL05286.1 NUDIX hydrolase [Rummeliibacillus stabekisii]